MGLLSCSKEHYEVVLGGPCQIRRFVAMFIVSCIWTFSIFVAVQQNELDTLRKIANDKNEKVEKRFDAILTIFRKHVPKHVDLESLSKTLGRQTWLDASAITGKRLIFGWVPV